VGGAIAQSGVLGEGMNEPAIGYLIVYHIEIALLFAALLALGPLVREDARAETQHRLGGDLAGRAA
jgi:MFS transporter, BCD family, chlorophyll transporter